MWTPEYFVRYVQLPRTIHGTVLPNDDGTYDIYINSLLSPDQQEQALAHELEHIREDHMYRDDCTVADLEAAADHQAPTPPPAAPQPIPAGTKVIPLYASPTAYLEHLKASGEFQHMIDTAHAQGVKLYGIDS